MPTVQRMATPLHSAHVVETLRKLGVRDHVQAVIAAYENGLVSPGG